LLLAGAVLVMSCADSHQLAQGDCDALISKAKKCNQSGVKNAIEAWCAANVGKSLDKSVWDFKSKGFLGGDCQGLTARVADFNSLRGR
jgi:hypothetical protein